MSNTVSTDLARRLQAAGLKWEPKRGDWVQWGEELELVCDVARDGFVRFNRWSSWVYNSKCLWLPTGDQCIEKIGQKLVSAQRSGWGGEATGYTLYMVEWEQAGVDRLDACPFVEAETLAEATGLALAEILEGEKS